MSSSSFFQVGRNFGEFGEGGLEVFYDVGGDDFGGREIGAFFEGFVFQPEDVEVHFVALEQFFVGEALKRSLSLRLCRFFGL